MDQPPPPSLTVMAEYFGGPLWARPDGNGEPVDPSSLGLPASLAAALREWNDVYERLGATGFVWQVPPTEQEWKDDGARLAVALQQALPAVNVWYWADGARERVVIPPWF